MAQSGYAPIQLYFSTISGHVPAAGDLVSGELAFNIPDGAVYYKNLSNIVTQLAGLSGYSGFSGISGYSGYSGSGVSGYSGFSGYSGAVGTGTSGYSGYCGYSGTNGAAILTTVNNFTNTNTFATTVSIGSTSTPGTLYVKGGNSNNLLVDNAANNLLLFRYIIMEQKKDNYTGTKQTPLWYLVPMLQPHSCLKQMAQNVLE